MESHHRELCQHRTRVHLHDSDLGVDQLFSQAVGEEIDSCLGRTINGSSRIRLLASNGPNVDDISGVLRLEQWDDCACHVDQPQNVGVEHSQNICWIDFTNAVFTKSLSGVVNQHVDISKLQRQALDEGCDGQSGCDVQLSSVDFNRRIVSEQVALKRLQLLFSSCGQNQLDVSIGGSSKLSGGGFADSRRSSGDEDDFVGQTLSGFSTKRHNCGIWRENLIMSGHVKVFNWQRSQFAGAVGGKHQRLSNNGLALPGESKHNDLGNVLGVQRLCPLVDGFRLGQVTSEPDARELGLNVTWVDLQDSDLGADQLFPQHVRERLDAGLGGTVDSSSGIRVSASDRAQIDDVTGVLLLHDSQHRACQVDEPKHVEAEHLDDVARSDFSHFLLSQGLASIIDQDIDVSKLQRQPVDERADRTEVQDIERGGKNGDVGVLLFQFVGQLIELLFSSSSQDQFDVSVGGVGQFTSSGLADAGGASCDQGNLACEPVGGFGSVRHEGRWGVSLEDLVGLLHSVWQWEFQILGQVLLDVASLDVFSLLQLDDLQDVDRSKSGSVSGGQVGVHGLDSADSGDVTVLLVHVVDTGSGVVSDPDTEGLDLGGVRLGDDVDGDDFTRCLLDLVQFA